jgi:DNA modification methylase
MTLNSFGEITIFTGNATKLPFPDNSVDLIIARPDYLELIQKEQLKDDYKEKNKLASEKEILKNLSKVTKEAYRVLKNNGSFLIANEEHSNLDARYLVQELDFSDFNYYGKILHNGYKEDSINFTTYEKINTLSLMSWYHFVKGNEPFVNPFKIKKYNNPVWNMSPSNIESLVDEWLLQEHPDVVNEVNQEVSKRFIEMFSKKGHIVLDMFGRTGVAATTAASLGRHAISNESSEEVVAAVKLRIMLTLGEKYLNEKVKVVKDEKLNNKKFRIKR